MEFNLYTLEQNITYRVQAQQRLAEQIRKASEASISQNATPTNHHLNKTSRKVSFLSLLGR